MLSYAPTVPAGDDSQSSAAAEQHFDAVYRLMMSSADNDPFANHSESTALMYIRRLRVQMCVKPPIRNAKFDATGGLIAARKQAPGSQ